MKKTLFILLVSLCVSAAHASKLSTYLNKREAQENAQLQREFQQDMNFADLSFRLERRFIGERGEQCRDYGFRARSNPYRHGHYSVCNNESTPRVQVEMPTRTHQHR